MKQFDFVLQCVAVVLQSISGVLECNPRQRIGQDHVLQCVAVCCSVLRYLKYCIKKTPGRKCADDDTLTTIFNGSRARTSNGWLKSKT